MPATYDAPLEGKQVTSFTDYLALELDSGVLDQETVSKYARAIKAHLDEKPIDPRAIEATAEAVHDKSFPEEKGIVGGAMFRAYYKALARPKGHAEEKSKEIDNFTAPDPFLGR